MLRKDKSSRWFEGYLKDMKEDQRDVNRKDCTRRFRMGKTVYLSKIEVTFPIVMRTEDEYYVKKESNNKCNKNIKDVLAPHNIHKPYLA